MSDLEARTERPLRAEQEVQAGFAAMGVYGGGRAPGQTNQREMPATPKPPPWETFEQNPDFADLDYKNQRRVRERWINDMAPHIEGFQELDPANQARFKERFLMEAPSVNTDNLSERGQQFLDIGESFREGRYTHREATEALNAAFSVNASEQSSWFRRVGNMAGNLLQNLGLLSEEDIETLGGADGNAVYTPETTADRNAFEYMLAMGSQDENIRDALRRNAVTGAVGGNILDIGTSILVASPVSAAARSTASAARAGEVTGRLGKFFRTPGTAFAVESATESVFMTAADRVRETFNEEVTRYPDVANRALRTGLLFGENFLADMAFWTFGRAIGRTVRMMPRVYTPKGLRGGIQRADSAEEALEQMRSGIRGIDSRVIGQTDDATRVREWREYQNDVRRAEAMTIDDIGSPDWMELELKSKGFRVDVTDTGAITLRGPNKITNNTKEITYRNLGTHPDMTTAFNRAVGYLDETYGIEKSRRIGDIDPTGPVKLTRIQEGTDARRVSQKPVTSSDITRFFRTTADGSLPSGNVRSAVQTLAASSDNLRPIGNVAVRRMDLGQWRRLAERHGGAIISEGGKTTSLDDFVRRMASSDRPRRELRADIVIPDGPVLPDDINRIVRSFENLAEMSTRGGKRTAASKKAAESLVENLRQASKTLEESPTSFKNMRVQLHEIGKEFVDPRTGRVLDNLTDIPRTGTIGIRQIDGTVRNYSDVTQAYLRETPRDWLTEKVLKDHLQREFGYTLQRVEDEGFYIRRKGDILRSNKPYRSLDDLLQDNPDLFPKRPIASLRSDVEFDMFTGEIRYIDGKIQGSEKEVMDYLESTFKRDGEVKDVITTDMGRVKFTPGETKYLVEMSDIGFKREFSSMDEAKDFLRRSKDDYEVLNDIALAAGTRIEFENGVFRMQLDDGSFAVSRSLEGMRSNLGKLIHDTEAAPELLRDVNLPDGFIRSMQNRYKRFFGDSLGTPRRDREYDLVEYVREKAGYGAGYKQSRKVGQFFRPFERMIRYVADDIGDPELLNAVYKRPRVAFDIYRQKFSVVERSVHDAFRGLGKKERIAAREAVLHPDRSVTEIFEQMGAKYDDRAQAAIDVVPEMFRIGANELGIDGYKLLRDYLPRIKKHFEEGTNVNLGESAAEMFKKIPGFENYNQIPELKFFANSMRSRDFYEYTRDVSSGLDQLVLGYFRKGLKSKYMAGAYEEGRRYLDRITKAGTIDSDMTRYLSGFMQELSGMAEDTAKRDLVNGTNDAIRRFYTEVLGKDDPKTVEQIANDFRSMTVAAHMSFRPFLPLRNMQQIWTTVGWRLGNDAVFEAQKRLARDPHGIVKDLIDQDVIVHGKAAMLEMYETGGASRMQKLNEAGMLWFRNSDDYNRAVTALASWIPYDDAVKRLDRGVIEASEFIQESRLDRMDPDIQRQVLELTEVGRHDEAKNVLARAWVNQTQFDYIQAGNPRLFKGVLGRMFGQYGHYSTNYRENLLRGFQNVSGKEKFASGARLALNTAGLYFVFERVLGINARNFHPFWTSMFAGGPYYDMINTGLAAASPGFEGNIARSQIGEETARNFIPLASYGYSFNQGKKLIDEGYTTEGILRLMTFPVIDPRKPTAR